jgi:hypothetical protein
VASRDKEIEELTGKYQRLVKEKEWISDLLRHRD